MENGVVQDTASDAQVAEENVDQNVTSEETNNGSASEVEARLKKSEQIKAQANKEAAGYRLKLRDAEKKLQEYETAQLQVSGNKDELIKKLSEQLQESSKTSEQKDKRYAYQLVSSSVRERAAKAGCIDPEAILKLADLDTLSIIASDNGYEIDASSVDDLINEMKVSKPYLFSKAAPKIVDGTPGKTPTAKTKKVGDFSRDELIELSKRMDNA